MRSPAFSIPLSSARVFLHITTVCLLLYALVVHLLLHSLTPLAATSATRNTTARNTPARHAPTHPGPLVTVVLTAYNIAPFINASIRATLHQTYRNLEVIIVDDASTDATPALIAALTAHDARVQTVRLSANTLGGVATASNIGIDRATGKYLAFIDGDDLPHPRFIERLLTLAESTNSDIAYCSFRRFQRHPGNLVDADEAGWRDLRQWPRPSVVNRSQTTPLSPLQFPPFNLNPVPWRKLYRVALLRRYGIRFPEGDYIFEDNSFHWDVNMHAARIAYLPEALVLHRVGRADQTTNSFRGARVPRGEEHRRLGIAKRLKGAMMVKHYANQNVIGHRIAGCSAVAEQCDLARKRFLRWIRNAAWVLAIVERVGNDKILVKMKSIKSRILQFWQAEFGVDDSEAEERVVNPDLAVSIVVPVYNDQVLLEGFVELLNDVTVDTEVIFVDDNSTDETLVMLKELTDDYDNMHLLHASGKGAGRARNYGLLFSEGQYVVFLDIADAFDPSILDSAVQHAVSEDVEVLMMKFELEHGKRQRSGKGFEVTSARGMSSSDSHLWKQRSTTDLRKRKSVAAKLTCHPWNKLVKRELLIRENIFFGATAVHNEVQFHWHSIFTARSLDFFDKAVVRHRRFDEREALNGHDGLTLPDALALTNRALMKSGLDEDREFRDTWRGFVKKMMKWGLGRVGEDDIREYERKAKELATIIDADHANKDLLVISNSLLA